MSYANGGGSCLDLSRIATHHRGVRPASTDVAAMVRETVAAQGQAWPAHTITRDVLHSGRERRRSPRLPQASTTIYNI